MEGNREEPLLGAGALDESPDVEERLLAKASVHEHAQQPALLRNVEPVRLGAGCTDPPRSPETRRERAEAELRPVGLGGSQRDRDRACCEKRGEGSHAANGSALVAELVDLAVERGGVDLACSVLTERGEARDAERLASHSAQLPLERAQAPDGAFAVVAVEVAAAGRGHRLAAVDVAARDRAAGGMAVRRNREDELPARVHLLGRGVARPAFPDAPAVVVQAALLPRRSHVDLLPVALADIADVEVPRGPVPRETPRVAQAVACDLPARACLVHVQAQQLAEPRAKSLRVVERIAAGAAVTHPH